MPTLPNVNLSRSHDPNSDDQLDLGQTLRGFVAGQKLFGRYILERILGRGGMGIVWLARDDELDSEVALKFLPELVVLDRAVLDDLKRETKRSLELTHHNTLPLKIWIIDRNANFAIEPKWDYASSTKGENGKLYLFVVGPRSGEQGPAQAFWLDSTGKEIWHSP